MVIQARWQQGAREGNATVSQLRQDQLVLETAASLQVGGSAFIRVRAREGEVVCLRAFVLGAKGRGGNAQRYRVSFELQDPSQVATLRRLARTSRTALVPDPQEPVVQPVPAQGVQDDVPTEPLPTQDATWLGRLRARMGKKPQAELLKRRIGAAA